MKKSDDVMKQVKRKDYLRVLCCMRKGSVAMTIAVGIKLDDITRLEVNRRGNLRLYTPEHWMNLGVHYKKIEWD